MDRRRPGSKHHLLTDGNGIPLAVLLTGGNRNDITQLIPLIEAIPPVRGKPGPAIARRGVPHGSGLGIYRWVVERSLAWLHQFKRLATRWEYRADIHDGLLKLACCLICWRYLDRSS